MQTHKVTTREQFLCAAKKGQGRAIAAMKGGHYQPTFHDLRRLVLRWPGYDAQCETTRGWYTAELIHASAYGADLSDLAIKHLARRKGSWRHRSHREALVGELAKRGSTSATDALHAGYDPAVEFRLAREILDAEGLAGLDWLIAQSVDYLVPDSAWRFKGWVDDLKSAFGDEIVDEWLAHESAQRPDVGRFAALVALEPHGEAPASESEKFAISYESLRDQWSRSLPEQISIFRWVRRAGDRELQKAWRAFESEDDPDWLRRLGRALSRKPEHRNVEKVIERARGWNNEYNPFVWAIEDLEDPRVRQLGFDLIDSGWPAEGVPLLATNGRPGDEPAILAALQGITGEWALHMTGQDVLRMPDTLNTAEMLLWVYENSPCSFCREYAVYDLIEMKQAPDWLLEECQYDCVDDTRELVRQTTALSS